MKLPAEILMMIFEFFTPLVLVSVEPLGHQCCCDLFNLRATCRKFRALVNELPFWFDPNFKLMEIIPQTYNSDSFSKWETYEAGFLKLLFQDQHLVQCLERRTSWHFMNYQTLLAVIECVPSFSLGTTYLSLISKACGHCQEEPDWRDNSINKSLRQLEVCQSLTSLMICTLEHSILDLDLIGKECPSLKWLHLFLVLQCKGTLRGLASLEELYSDSCFTFNPKDGLLPVDSAASLTRLALLFERERFWLDEACRQGTFDKFVNLKSLYVHPLSHAVCDFLLDSTIELNEFRTTVIKEYGDVVHKVIAMFSKRSLCNLHSLCLALEDHTEWRPLYQSIIDSITTNLTNVEQMVLGMGLDVSWWPMFAKLRQLQRLRWFVPEDAYQGSQGMSDEASEMEDNESDWETISDEGSDYGEDTINVEDKLKPYLKAELNAWINAKMGTIPQFNSCVCSSGAHLPDLSIRLLGAQEYTGVTDCHAIPELYYHYLHDGRVNVYEDGHNSD